MPDEPKQKSFLIPRLIATALWLFIGYLVGVWLSNDLVSAYPAQTDWANVLVYAWMIFWPLGILYNVGIWWALGIVAAIIILLGLGHNKYDGFTLYGWYFNWR